MIRNILRRAYNLPLKKIYYILPQPLQRLAMKAASITLGYGMPFDKIPRIYVTLQCNLRCPYCSDGLAYDKSGKKYQQLNGARWIEIINGIPGNAVIFTGGEPTLHRDLPEIINSIRQENVIVYTNLAYDVEKFLSKLKKPVFFFTSFHPNNPGVTLEKSIAALRTLKAHPMCRDIVSHHIIEEESNAGAEAIKKYKRAFSSAGFKLLVYKNQFEYNAVNSDMCSFTEKRKVRCTYDRMLLGPDGKRYFCVSKMVRNAPTAAIPLDMESPSRLCEEYGYCSPCDEVAEIEFLER